MRNEHLNSEFDKKVFEKYASWDQLWNLTTNQKFYFTLASKSSLKNFSMKHGRQPPFTQSLQ